ncbi:MAG: ABC transporter substrate-binding protein [Pseudomonadota bacterium]
MNKFKYYLMLFLILGPYVSNAGDYHTTIDVIPTNWDPREHKGGFYLRLSGQIFCSLLQMDDNLNVSPDLAMKWWIDKNGKRYIFLLRDDVFFHNGRSVTADDVIYSLNRMKQRSALSLDLQIIKHISKPNNNSDLPAYLKEYKHDRVVIIELKEPFSQMMSLLANITMAIFPEAELKENSDLFFKKPISCGPFKLADLQSNVVIMDRNEKYHGVKNPTIDRLVFHKVNSIKAAELFNEGKLDDIVNLMVDESKIKREFSKLEGWIFITRFIRLNTKSSVFNKLQCRRAFISAFDRVLFIEKVGLKKMIPATGFIPKGMLGHLENSPFIYEPKESKKLWQQAKCNAHISVVTSRKKEAKAIKFVADNMKKTLGVSLDIKYVDPDTWYKKWHDFKDDAILGGMDSMYIDPYFILKHADSHFERNYMGIKDPNIDKLLSQASKEHEKEMRSKIYQKIDELIMKHSTIMPLYYGDVDSGIYSAKVKGLRLPPTGTNYVKYNSVKLP